jgi:RNA polymerase sigma-70 factor (ECF subfamily)
MSEHYSPGDLSIDLEELTQRRNPPAPDRLARTVRRLVRRYCRARLGALPSGYALADDLAAEVTADLLRDGRRRLGRSEPVEAVVYEVMADAVTHVLAEASSSEPEDVAVPAELLVELNRLPREPREVLVLRVFVGLSSEQVGRAMGLSLEKVRAEQHRALAHLRPP